MSLIDQIDFKRIAPRNGSQPDAFEEFCCQIAMRCPDVPPGSEFERFRGAGGDGGVECIWRLPNGDEWGWQAKYMFDLTKAKAALEKSVATAIKVHPRLTRYAVCLPFDLTGPTNRKGKSQSEYFDEYRKGWESKGQAVNVQMKVLLATPTTLLDELLSFDPNGGRLRYWFDATILSDEWFRAHLQDVKASAYPRYTPELRIETPVAEAFEALGLTEEWFASLASRVKEFSKVLDEWKRSVASTSDAIWAAPFPPALRPDGEKACELLAKIGEQYQQIAESRDTTTDISALATDTNEALQCFREIRVALVADLEAEYGPGRANSAQFRQVQADYEAKFPASNLDAADEAIKFIEELLNWTGSPVARLPGASELLIDGLVGVGKTHAICDMAEKRSQRGLRTVVLFGERFLNGTEPWEQIRQQLGFDVTLTRDTMLAALDAAGEASGKPLLLCLDGLNETWPRTFWRPHLPAMLTQLRRYKWLRLCISCRTTYKSQVIPTRLDMIAVTHQGFRGIEFDACPEFFAHYQLEPPVTPILQPEFANPLFLRLVCEAMVAAGYTRLPSGWHGINTVIKAFVQEKNRRYAIEHDTHPGHRFPERALKAFIRAAYAAERPVLSWVEASHAIESVLPISYSHGPLMDWLLREGMLIVDAALTGDEFEEHVRVAFERLGDHLLADQFLEDVNRDAVEPLFETSGPLAFALSDTTSLNEYAGLIQALAVQLPERFGVELPDCIQNDDLRDDLMKATVEGLLWRDPHFMTERTCEIVQRSLRFDGFADTVFNVALSIGPLESAADALWLHQVLAGRSMAGRDLFWCGYLHQQYEKQGPVEKLIQAAFRVEVERVPRFVVRRWGTLLLWFCAAADRRVRDHATKALVRITEPDPALWKELIEQFITVNDEFIIERCLAAAYGTLLRGRDQSAERLIAGVVFDEVFKDSSRFQNALIRDYARSILELAAHDNVLPEGIAEADYMPPYKSEWPLYIPEADELEQWLDWHETVRLLHWSCCFGDFKRYTLNRLTGYDDTLDANRMGRWIFQHVLDLGYLNPKFANYDGYMVNKYGGGRGKPKWAERIGKKYQWIALARLAARVTDHVEKRSRWDPEPLRTPLSYEDGRDIDPSWLLRGSLAEKTTSWWLPEEYDFENVSAMNNREWTARYLDMPNTSAMLSERLDEAGKRWIVLEGYPGWSSKSRRIWLHLHSYLIPTAERDSCWEWLQKQNFMGRWMPEGTSFHEGFVGEYPWGISFNLYEDSYLLHDGLRQKKPPCQMIPTSNSLSVSYEYNAYEEESISIHLPARCFFDDHSLRWNRASGYLSADGQLRFFDPSVVEPGPSALLVDSDFLQDFLSKHNLSIVWTVLGEKLIIGAFDSPRLVYSRAHMLGPDGLLSSKPVISND